jgi:hypothetical protein
MSDILYDEIPALNLEDFTANDLIAKQHFVEAIGNAYHLLVN